MQQYYETKAKGHNAEIIAVNLTYAEHGADRRSKVENFQKEYKLTFPILLDEQGEIGAMYRAVTIPTTYMMDAEGVIRKKIIGPLDEERLEFLVNELVF
jgi:peroxiredoxin